MKSFMTYFLVSMVFCSAIFAAEKVDIGLADQAFNRINTVLKKAKDYIDQTIKNNPKTVTWLKTNPKMGLGIAVLTVIITRTTYISTKKFMSYLYRKLQKNEKSVCKA